MLGMTDLASRHLSLAWYLNGMWSDLVPCSLVGPSALRGQSMASGLRMA